MFSPPNHLSLGLFDAILEPRVTHVGYSANYLDRNQSYHLLLVRDFVSITRVVLGGFIKP